MSTEVIKNLSEKASSALELARKVGDIIGFVSRTSPSLIDEEGGSVVFDVDPIVYFDKFADIASAGSYLAVVDIKTGHIVSLRVVSVERRDVLAELELPEAYFPMVNPDVTGLLTKTRVRARPLLSLDPEKLVVNMANYVIEPQSPVIKPRDPGIAQLMLGLPSEGVFTGFVTTGDIPVFDAGIPLFIPLKAFFQHMLVLGTTGSGKTTLLKNVIASMLSSYNLPRAEDITIVILDPNKDYVTLPLKPFIPEDIPSMERELITKFSKNAHRPKGLVILLPVTNNVVEAYNRGVDTWAGAMKKISEMYVEDAYSALFDRFGWRWSIKELVVHEEPGRNPLRFVKIILSVKYPEEEDFTAFIIPYGFRFQDFHVREFIALNPYFTRQAKDVLSRLLKKLEELGSPVKSIMELYDMLRASRYYMEHKNQPVSSKWRGFIELVEDLAIHKSTLENILRQLGSLIDTGLFDISIGGNGEVLAEASIYEILEKHKNVFSNYPIVVDLEFLQEYSEADPEKVIGVAAYRVLNKVFEWKIIKSREKVRTQPVVIFIDEAHRFFPSKGGGGEEFIEHVSGMIDRIARLGRSRGLGLVFSTHSPVDVHDIILQLANTKIVLRMDKTHISSLDLPSEYRDFVTRCGDRVGIVKSHTLRLGYVSFKTPLPIAGHYDLSNI
ncbi:ATP-binding protein [Thermogladius sp. 4427co]|uniref:ATP-binding protein n=1 Tax=Thermogladius sp. 4427co TaxID=3450718 RepID=UPI003F79C41F